MEVSKHISLPIEGMSCTNCALAVTNYLEGQGLKEVQVSFPNAEANFQLNGDHSLEEIVRGIQGLGFSASLNTSEDAVHSHSGIKWRLIISAIFTIPLFLAMFLPFKWLHDPLVQTLLCLPVMIIGLDFFGTSAWRSLRNGFPNMDVLIVIGSSAAFIYSILGYTLGLGPNYLFFETAATIITLVLLGNYMEHRAVQRTTHSIKELSSLQPKTAKRITTNNNGDELVKEIDCVEIKKGHILLINTGDSIPTDGVIIWGSGSANESMMTGESHLIEKKIDNEVIGGTVLEAGSIKMKATRVGSETTLSQIIQLVKEAQNKKPPIQKLADKVSAVFVPAVLIIAGLAFGLGYGVFNLSFTQALLNGIAVLVIACPCAMGLATPTALMVGIGRAAQNGILIKGGSTVESFAKVKKLVFDKTGTLTTGRFKVEQIETDIKQSTFLSILLSLEKHSSHPLAKALIEQFDDVRAYPLTEVKEIKGVGVMGKDAHGNTYSAGSYSMAASLTDEDHHNVYVLKNGELIGWIDMDDTLKINSVATIQELKDAGLHTVLLSGDKEDKTKIIAEQTAVDEYYAEKLPDEKLEIIAQLNRKNDVAMIGDGINDAPALTQAAVGVSLSDASQIAIQSSDVVLLNGDLSKLKTAWKLSKHTVITIRQNLFWAFFYNVLAIPLAAVGLLSPMIAAFTMAFSDIIVIGNSIRLRTKKLK